MEDEEEYDGEWRTKVILGFRVFNCKINFVKINNFVILLLSNLIYQI
jgi:hypothetical protein